MNLLKEIDGNGWKKNRAILSTFPFDARFFSRFVRSRLSRADCSLPLVFVDESVYNKYIGSEWKRQPIGDKYLLEPVSTQGVFHPKVNLYLSSQSVYYTISSANLTLPEYCDAVQLGSSGCLQKSWLDGEEPDHDTLQVAAVADEIRHFYTRLASTSWVTGTDAIQYVDEMDEELSWLDDAPVPVTRSAWFLDNLQEPILDQVERQLGDIERAVLSAPYFGSISILQNLFTRLDADRVDLVVEDRNTNLDAPGVAGAGPNEITIRKFKHHSNRWIHAKFLILRGQWGSAVLYGSPNMTGTALLEDATTGNLEAGLLRLHDDPDYYALPIEDAPGAITGSPFVSPGFEYEISGPIAPGSIEPRTESYEDWGQSGTGGSSLRLQDVRLSTPETEGDAKLTVTVASEQLSGERTISIRPSTDTGPISRRIDFDLESVDVIIEVPEDRRGEWARAVIVVEDVESGAESNPRRVTPETQAYLTEYRELTESGGRQGASDLLEAFLFNGASMAGIVLKEGIEFLMDIESSGGSDQQERDGAGSTREWRERRFRALSGRSPRPPSPENVIKTLLTHYLQRADTTLDADPAGMEDVEEFVSYLEQFWELIELLQTAHGHGLLPGDVANACSGALRELYHEHKLREFRTRLGDLISRIEQNAGESSDNNAIQSVENQPEWVDVFRVFYSHPAFVLDIGVELDTQFISPQVVVTETHHLFRELTPYVLTHLFDPATLHDQRIELENQLATRLSNRIDEFAIDARSGYEILLFGILLRGGEDNVRALRSSPIVANPTEIGMIAIRGQDALESYDLKSLKLLAITPGYLSANRAIAELAEHDE